MPHLPWLQQSETSSKTGALLNASNDKNKPPLTRSQPAWQTPAGLTSGNWDYVRSKSIASKYAEFLADDPLAAADQQVIESYLPPLDSAATAPLVADFGCGNGRNLLPLLRSGYRGLGIDLSQPMLKSFDASANAMNLSDKVQLAQANLVTMDAFANDSMDAGICMFSTLGMIQGHTNRHQFLTHVRRVLKPGQPFIVHAHNTMFQLRHPGGVTWAANSLWRALRGKQEFGDRTADYRGLRNLFIHSFRRRELRAALKAANLVPQHWLGVEPAAAQLRSPLPWFSSLRVIGWIVVCY